MNKLKSQVAVVTGAMGGLGQEVCMELAREGASIAALDRVPDGSALVARLRDLGVKALYMPLDITDEQQVRDALQHAEQKLGCVRVLVNCAAITGSSKPTHEATVQEFDEVFAVNVKGTFLSSKYAIQSMLRGAAGGSIINISSTYGVVANADIPMYHATKAAVLMMAKTDAVTYADKGIRANAIVLGSTRTPMTQAAMAISAEGAEYLRKLIEAHPLKRQAEPVEIARVVAFLASSDSSFITATAIPVDGGYTAV